MASSGFHIIIIIIGNQWLLDGNHPTCVFSTFWGEKNNTFFFGRQLSSPASLRLVSSSPIDLGEALLCVVPMVFLFWWGKRPHAWVQRLKQISCYSKWLCYLCRVGLSQQSTESCLHTQGSWHVSEKCRTSWWWTSSKVFKRRASPVPSQPSPIENPSLLYQLSHCQAPKHLETDVGHLLPTFSALRCCYTIGICLSGDFSAEGAAVAGLATSRRFPSVALHKAWATVRVPKMPMSTRTAWPKTKKIKDKEPGSASTDPWWEILPSIFQDSCSAILSSIFEISNIWHRQGRFTRYVDLFV